jgi:CheY-like chemotaxis protein
VVEDDARVCEALSEVLAEEGYDVTAARDGQEALELLGAMDPPCVMLVDLMMPRMDGWAFIAEIQKREGLGKIPICVVSALPSQAPRGVASVIAKPLDLDVLLPTIERFCAPKP